MNLPNKILVFIAIDAIFAGYLLTKNETKRLSNVSVESEATNKTVKSFLTNPIPALPTPRLGCLLYGPVSASSKNVADKLIRKEGANAVPVKTSLYEIYWNLGTDETKAKREFASQSETPLFKSGKFKIEKTGIGWIVPMGIVSGSEPYVLKSVRNLDRETANIGGKWLFHKKGDEFYYKIENPDAFEFSAMNDTGMPKISCSDLR